MPRTRRFYLALLAAVVALVPIRITIAQSTIPQTLSPGRSEEHTSELQSQFHLVCRLLLEKKKIAYEALGNDFINRGVPVVGRRCLLGGLCIEPTLIFKGDVMRITEECITA